VTPKLLTIDQMALNVTSGVSGNARVGIYADDGNGYPGALVVDCGGASTASTQVNTYTGNLPTTLPPGNYWLVHVGDAAPTLRCFAVASMAPVLGFTSTLPTTPSLGWTVSFNYAALPDPFPANASVITATPIPCVFLRASN